MSIFSSIQIANNALQAAQIGLQVTGNNIANANTPGYLRQEAVFEPSPPQKLGGLVLGTGVSVAGIKQQTDRFLEERVRDATADLANGETQESTYTQLETILGELGDNDLSTSLTKFFGSLNDVLNQPESLSVRNLASLQGQRLADNISRLDSKVSDLRDNLNNRVLGTADTINSLLEKVAKLNVQIVSTEGGVAATSDAVGLRDSRNTALNQLAKIIDVKAIEQPTGSVSVMVGGDLVVFDGTARRVKAVIAAGDGFHKAEIRLSESDAPVPSTSGELAGLITSRDGIVGGFLDKLNNFSRTLAFEFNKVFSSGQGLTGYSDLTSEFGGTDPNLALDHAGLPFTPVNGSFQLLVRNKQTGLTQTTDVQVDLNGLDQDTSLASLVTTLDGIAGISAALTSDNQLRLQVDSSNLEFSFANDTSGALAALGLNTFFSGDSSANLSVNSIVKTDPSKLAVSSGGIGHDSANAELLAGFGDRSLDSQGGESLTKLYEQLASDTAQSSAVSKSVADGFRVFQSTLEGQQLAISGVNLDSEAVKMITYQRMFQASAKYISTLSNLLDDLVKL